MTITRITARYRVATPMFIEGIDTRSSGVSGVPEVRATSYKGVLRFWFRALAWAEYGNLQDVRAVEEGLFGSVRTGQSGVVIALTELEKASPLPAGTTLGPGCAYMAGLGLSKFEKKEGVQKATRSALGEGTVFEARHIVRVNRGRDMTKEFTLLRNSIVVLGLTGGMGARSRRGFGSLTLEAIVQDGREMWRAPTTLVDVERRLRDALGAPSASCSEPPYTAFSADSRFILVPGAPRSTAEDLLERLGKALLHFRSFGRASKSGGSRRVAEADALGFFSDDHDEMLAVANGAATGVVRAPCRAAFGLPHNYFFGSIEAKVDVNAARHKRRASPLFVHIHAPEEGDPIGIVSFIPGTFLPDMSLTIQRTKPTPRKTYTATLPTGSQLWDPINNFLEELRDPGTVLCEKFPGAYEVKL